MLINLFMWNKHNNINSEEYLYLSVKLFIEQGRGGRGCHRRNDLFFFFSHNLEMNPFRPNLKDALLQCMNIISRQIILIELN